MESRVIEQTHIPAPLDSERLRAVEGRPYRGGRGMMDGNVLSPFLIQSDIDLVVSFLSGERNTRTSVFGSIDKELLPTHLLSENSSPGSLAVHVLFRWQGEEFVNRDEIHFAIPPVTIAEGE